jgi:hypothetical protein
MMASKKVGEDWMQYLLEQLDGLKTVASLSHRAPGRLSPYFLVV